MNDYCCPCDLLIHTMKHYEIVAIRQASGDSHTFVCDSCKKLYPNLYNGYKEVLEKVSAYTDTSRCRFEVMVPYEEWPDSTVRFNVVFGWLRVPLMYHHSDGFWISSDVISFCKDCLDNEHAYTYGLSIDRFVETVAKFVETPDTCCYCDNPIFADQVELTKCAHRC